MKLRLEGFILMQYLTSLCFFPFHSLNLQL